MPGVTLLIVSALVRREESLLLVEQQGPGDREPRWMLPGGRVETDETLLIALRREIAEETGLALDGTPAIAFAVELRTHEGSYSALTFDCRVNGDLRPDDPDGFVRAAAWIPLTDAIDRLRLVEWYDCVPIQRYLSGEASAGTVYPMERT